METVKFYSNKLKKEITAEVIEKRKRTWKLNLPNKIIVKRINQLLIN